MPSLTVVGVLALAALGLGFPSELPAVAIHNRSIESILPELTSKILLQVVRDEVSLLQLQLDNIQALLNLDLNDECHIVQDSVDPSVLPTVIPTEAYGKLTDRELLHQLLIQLAVIVVKKYPNLKENEVVGIDKILVETSLNDPVGLAEVNRIAPIVQKIQALGHGKVYLLKLAGRLILVDDKKKIIDGESIFGKEIISVLRG